MGGSRPGWACHGQVRIHYLEWGELSPDRPSLLISAGIWEPAERAQSLLSRLDWPHRVSFSYRGRGQSDTPTSGYDLEDHLGDLEAVVAATGISRVIILGFSRGVACALQFALDHPERTAGVIVGDLPPTQSRWTPGTAEYWKNMIYLGRPLTDFIRPQAVDALEREAREVSLWDRLPEIHCPVLILRGLRQDHPIPPNLSAAESARYLRLLPAAREVGFVHSGHMLPDDEPDEYRRVVQEFLSSLAGEG